MLDIFWGDQESQNWYLLQAEDVIGIRIIDKRRDTMRKTLRSFFIAILLGLFTGASAQLPPEIRADAYLLQAEQAIRNGDLVRAQAAIQNILRLQKEHELDLSDEFHFRYAKAADAADLSDQALESVLKYLVASGREGQHYVEALALMNNVQDRSSGNVVASQLSPNIVTDAYLLQAEQAIRNGDHNRTRGAVQNIRNLQEQHELDLPNEFHFRYAKAADAVDLPDHALESVLKYLAVSGREGQHYFEALALMNKVQMAVSCKGWDTEEYFKTVTLEEVTACLDTGVDLKARDDVGATPLHRAAQNTENPDMIKALLNAGAGLGARDKYKNTPLHYAVLNKNTGVIETLLNAGADIEAQDKYKNTPLSDAVFFKRPAAIKVLIEAGADTRIKDKWTSLHWAATYNENPVAIKALLNSGANPKAKDDDKQTPLHIATQFGNLVAIKALLNAGADLKARGMFFEWTPLHYAAKYSKNPETVKTLLNAGADLKARDKDKRTPLHFAAWHNANPEIVKTLFEAETDYKDRKKNRWSLLHHAATYHKNPEAVKALIESGIDPEAQDPAFKQTPLHRAVYNENPDILNVLLDAGADPKARDRSRRTPLHGAAYNKNLDVVKILLNAGADPKARRHFKITPLHWAARNNENPAIVQALIEAGADLNAKTSSSYTPLHWAVAYNKNPDVVKALINAGANLEAQAYGDSTPLHEAAENNENPDVIRILLSAGANLNAQNKKGFTPLGLSVENNENPDVVRVLREAGASQTKIAGKSQQGDGLKTAIALLGGAAIGYAGQGSEESMDAARQFMEGVLNDQPAGNGNSNSATTPSQSQGGQAPDRMQQALQNLENVCGEKYQGNFSDDDHYRFYCMAAFNDYCALKRAQSSDTISKLRASLQQNCAVLKSVGADSKCSYCK